MTDKFTPGPWYVVEAVNGDWPSGCEMGIDNVEGGNSETDYCIASAVHGDPDTLLANARLIAAAPELLHAAVAALELLKVIHDETGKVGMQLQAAIAKARGL